MKTIHVAAAIIVRNGLVLATQRGYGDYAGGWEFPGGKLEPGEDGAAAAVREIREELGAAIAVDRLVTTVEYDYPEFHLSMQCYLCHLTDDHLELREHTAARWLSCEELGTVDWLPADIAVVDALRGYNQTTYEQKI